ncbi:MAG: laccase domain-containing protein, partial [Planctomycetota bacterium]
MRSPSSWPCRPPPIWRNRVRTRRGGAPSRCRGRTGRRFRRPSSIPPPRAARTPPSTPPGFLTPVSRYDSTLDHLATHGFLVIASRSGGELFPSHAAFAADLVHCLDHVIALGEDPASEFHQHVAADRLGVGGHSMGGGCSLLAAASDARIGAVVPLAAADTNPSSIAASGEIAAPVRLIVGSEDAIVPSGPSSGPMYSNLRGPRQLVSIEGGSHCGFLDSDIIFCDTGSITRAAQLAHTWRLATSFLLLHLADEESLWREVWGPLASPQAGLELEIDPRLAIVPSSRTLEVPASGLEVAWSVQNTGEEPCTVAFDRRTGVDRSRTRRDARRRGRIRRPGPAPEVERVAPDRPARRRRRRLGHRDDRADRRRESRSRRRRHRQRRRPRGAALGLWQSRAGRSRRQRHRGRGRPVGPARGLVELETVSGSVGDGHAAATDTGIAASIEVLRGPTLEKAGFRHGFSTRRGGVSDGPFASLNLGVASAPGEADPLERIMENRRRFGHAVTGEDLPWALSRQVHGAEVHWSEGEVVEPRDLERLPIADAIVGRESGRLLSVRTADCLPILLGCSRSGLAAAVHAGWRGLVVGTIP